MMTKMVKVDGKDVAFKASAAIPRLYRIKFRRDIFRDLKKLSKAVEKNEESESEIPIDDLEMFENIAYIMAQHADPKNVPSNVIDWLDNFNTFSIYQILPELIDLWNLNTATEIESKKKFDQLRGK